MKTFTANPRVRGFTAADNSERYKLHKKIRAKDINCKIFARSRTILIPVEMEEIDPMLYELSTLYGYKIQTETFT